MTFGVSFPVGVLSKICSCENNTWDKTELIYQFPKGFSLTESFLSSEKWICLHFILSESAGNKEYLRQIPWLQWVSLADTPWVENKSRQKCNNTMDHFQNNYLGIGLPQLTSLRQKLILREKFPVFIAHRSTKGETWSTQRWVACE